MLLLKMNYWIDVWLYEWLNEILNQSVTLIYYVSGLPRQCVLHKGRKGFGFVLRGAKAASPLMDMIPSHKCPSLQYMDDVDPGGVADLAGIKKESFYQTPPPPPRFLMLHKP